MKRNFLAAWAAVALLMSSGVASAQDVTWTLQGHVGYVLSDLTPDDGQAPILTFTEGRDPVGNAWETSSVGDIFSSRFTVSPNTQVTFDGFVSGNLDADTLLHGTDMYSKVFFLDSGGGGFTGWVSERVGKAVGRLTDHEIDPVHYVLTNNTDHDVYALIEFGSGISFYATGVPEAPSGLMMLSALGLFGLAGLSSRRACSRFR